MVIFGSRLFGKVDAVPGLGHVATKFFHINFLPLIPTEGWLVTAQEGNQWRGCAIPMSFKSVLVAWLRFGLFAAGAFLTIIGLVALSSREAGSGGILGAGIGSIAGFTGTYLWSGITKASPDRAIELAEHAGVPPEGVAQIRRMYETGIPPLRR